MEETYYLRDPKKRKRRVSTTRTSRSRSPSESQAVPSIEQLQQQYGGDKVELVASDGEVRSINFSDFSFN